MSHKILVAEDDFRLRRITVRALADQGYEIDETGDGDEAWALVQQNAYDVVLLDWMLPGRAGVEIVRRLRDEGSRVAIILVTAKTRLEDRVEGLDVGADDYVPKPFHVDEILARVRACTRRGHTVEQPIRELRDLRLDLVRHQIEIQGEVVDTTEREFSLIELLSRAPGQIYTRSQILGEVWGINYNPRTNILDVYVNRLRRKFGERKGRLSIETIRSVGYRLTAAPA